MTIAVHGKASIAELLAHDVAGKNSDADGDKIDTVDFGATLMALFDPHAGVQPDQAGSDDSGVSAAGSKPADGKHSKTPPEVEAGSRAEQLDQRFPSSTLRQSGIPSRVEASSQPRAQFTERPNETAGKLHDVRPASFDSPTASHRADPTVPRPAHQTVAGPTGVHPEIQNAQITAAPIDAANSKSTAQTAFGTDNAEPKIAPGLGLPVPDADISLDLRKQTFSSKAPDDAAATSSKEIPRPGDLAKVASSVQFDATPSNPAKSPLMRNDVAHSSSGRASDGTSPALSSQSGHRDAMNPNDTKLSQPTTVNPAADATASSAQISSQKPLDSIASMTPQPQRIRTASAKDAARQSSDQANLAPDASASVDAKPIARSSEVAPIRMTPEVTSAREPAHSVSITVQLASGQTAQASVRERAGAVDVKILTPTVASAQRVSLEMDGMRQNLDSAGIKLGQSEVSYQRGDGGQQGHREGYRPPAQNQSTGKDVFIMNEVIQ